MTFSADYRVYLRIGVNSLGTYSQSANHAPTIFPLRAFPQGQTFWCSTHLGWNFAGQQLSTAPLAQRQTTATFIQRLLLLSSRRLLQVLFTTKLLELFGHVFRGCYSRRSIHVRGLEFPCRYSSHKSFCDYRLLLVADTNSSSISHGEPPHRSTLSPADVFFRQF
jgi:hypothetical protein